MPPAPHAPPAPIWWTVHADPVIRRLWQGVGLLVILHIAAAAVSHWTPHSQVFGVIPLLNLDREQSLGTLLSVLLLGTASALLAGIAHQTAALASPHAPRWRVLAWVFALMATDEFLGFHELLTRPLQLIIGEQHGVLHDTWVLVGGALVIATVSYFWSFWRALEVRCQRRLRWAAMLYVGGAIGCEMLGGRHIDAHGTDFIYALYTSAEEGLEMAGALLFVSALAHHHARLPGAIGIRVLVR